jgi:hypothetical protein
MDGDGRPLETQPKSQTKSQLMTRTREQRKPRNFIDPVKHFFVLVNVFIGEPHSVSYFSPEIRKQIIQLELLMTKAQPYRIPL